MLPERQPCHLLQSNLSFSEANNIWLKYLIALEALIISLILGTPKVMFIEATPAKWKVFSVICVPGSPMLWAHRAPTAEPGSICALHCETKRNICIFTHHLSKCHLGASLDNTGKTELASSRVCTHHFLMQLMLNCRVGGSICLNSPTPNTHTANTMLKVVQLQATALWNFTIMKCANSYLVNSPPPPALELQPIHY